MEREHWLRFKKELPKNWAQEVAVMLNNKGFHLCAQQVSLVRSGAIKNAEWQEKVWIEIKNLRNISKKQAVRLSKLKAA